MAITFGAIAKRSAPEDMKFYTSTGTVNCDGKKGKRYWLNENKRGK